MTELTKPVRRKTTLLLDNRIHTRARDRVTVTLYPDLTIGFRPYRARRDVRLPLAVVYKLALMEERKQKDAEKKRRRLVKRGLL